MKKWMICLGVLACCQQAGAQQKSNATRAAKGITPATKRSAAATPPATINYNSVGAYPAKAGSRPPVFIADPTIRAFNMRSSGMPVPIGRTGVVGVPRGTYGFANGQVYLRSTDATSIGGITGNGSVGTGSSPGSVGTSGFVPFVNGKSPYAGPTIWGSASGLNLPDSIARNPGNRPGDR